MSLLSLSIGVLNLLRRFSLRVCNTNTVREEKHMYLLPRSMETVEFSYCRTYVREMREAHVYVGEREMHSVVGVFIFV
jgi:hypothetical protein